MLMVTWHWCTLIFSSGLHEVVLLFNQISLSDNILYCFQVNVQHLVIPFRLCSNYLSVFIIFINIWLIFVYAYNKIRLKNSKHFCQRKINVKSLNKFAESHSYRNLGCYHSSSIQWNVSYLSSFIVFSFIVSSSGGMARLP